MMWVTVALFIVGMSALVYAALCKASDADDAADRFTQEQEYAEEGECA